MHQSALRSPRSLAPRRFHHSPRQRRPLPLLRRFPPQRSPAARPALPHAPPLAHRPPAPPSPPALGSPSSHSHRENKKAGSKRFRLFCSITLILALDEALLDHLLVAEPQIGDVG